MNKQAVQQRTGTRLIASKSIFQSTIVVFFITIVAVWIWSIIIHRTVFENALISTSFLSVVSALFFTVALYKGFKLKDTLGRITDKFKWEGLAELPALEFGGAASAEGGESFLNIVFILIAGLLVTILFYFSLWVFGNLLWAFTLSVSGILYWIFFRAVRLVLKSTKTCKDKLLLSFVYGVGYTLFYSILFYSIILVPHFFW